MVTFLDREKLGEAAVLKVRDPGQRWNPGTFRSFSECDYIHIMLPESLISYDATPSQSQACAFPRPGGRPASNGRVTNDLVDEIPNWRILGEKPVLSQNADIQFRAVRLLQCLKQGL